MEISSTFSTQYHTTSQDSSVLLTFESYAVCAREYVKSKTIRDVIQYIAAENALCIKFVRGHLSYHNRKFPLYVFVWSREGKTNLISALFSLCFSGIKTKFRRAKIRPDLRLRKTERFFLARFYLRHWMLSREKKKEGNKKSWCLLVYVVKWLMWRRKIFKSRRLQQHRQPRLAVFTSGFIDQKKDRRWRVHYIWLKKVKKIRIVPNESYHGCQRLLMRGFRFRSSLKKSSAEGPRRVGLRPTKLLVTREKKSLVPRVNESSFIIISLSINLYWLNLPCHVSNRLRRSAADFNMGCFYRFINLDVLLQKLT